MKKDAIDWINYDRNHVWHPYSSILNAPPVFPVVHAENVYLHLADGRQLVDGMASWWSAIHGYQVKAINHAIEQQLKNMAHVMFGGLTHEPAVTLAKKLIDLTAAPLQYVFLADSGSIAVEVAIKMALQYWLGRGVSSKQKLLTLRQGYHGDTFATMAICDPENGMHQHFAPFLTRHYFAVFPDCDEDSQWSDDNMADFEKQIQQHHQSIAAVILEPIVQGAGAMRFYCPEYLRQVKQLCETYDVLLILDEIATGFGRSGTLFAYQQADITPDILCLGKALTGGSLTLAAVLTTDKVVFSIDKHDSGVLLHGPTFMANPLACAAANASIDLLLASPWQQRVLQIEQQMRTQLAPIKANPVVNDVRCKGAIGVIELKQAVDMQWIQPQIVALGVWIRPFGRLLYIMPPYIITRDALSKLTDAMKKIVLLIEKRPPNEH